MKVKWIAISIFSTSLMGLSDGLIEEIQDSEKLNLSHNAKLELIPVKTGVSEDKRALHLHGKPLLKISKKPVVKMNDINFKSDLSQEVPELKIPLSEKNAKHLEKAHKRFGNEHLAFVINGYTLAAPKISDSVDGEKVKIEMSENDLEIFFHNLKS